MGSTRSKMVLSTVYTVVCAKGDLGRRSEGLCGLRINACYI